MARRPLRPVIHDSAISPSLPASLHKNLHDQHLAIMYRSNRSFNMPPPGNPPGEFKLVYILNLESVTILFNIEEQAQANSMNHKTAVNVAKKLTPFCLHKKSHFGKIFVSKQPLENRIRLESNFEHDLLGGLSQ